MKKNLPGPDIDLSIQVILNFGAGGTCHGGNPTTLYAWIKEQSDKGYGLPVESCMVYEAVDGKPEFTPVSHPSGRCMTCSTFNVPCVGIDSFPNATVTEYGSISGEQVRSKV